LRTFAGTHDLSVPEHYAHVAERMDVDNFLVYQIAEIYFGNADWPQNNVRVWRRRRPDPFPGRDAEPPGHDGRWRWMLFDLDLSCGHPWAGGYGENTLSYALSPTGRPGTNSGSATIFLRALMQNPEFKRRFASTAADLLNSHFKESRAVAMVDAMRATMQPAMSEHIRRWQSNGNSMNTWSGTHVGTLRTHASQRAINVRQHFTTHLDLGGYAPLTVTVEPAGSGRIRVNRLVIDERLPGTATPVYPWRGTYFRGVPVELEALPAPGFGFAGWTTPAGAFGTPVIALTLTGPSTATAAFSPATMPPAPAVLGRPQPRTGGGWTLSFEGPAGARWQLQFSSDLVAWETVASFLTDAAGRSEIVLPPAPAGPASGFYRAGPE
jgi:hypothetical protein